MDERKKHGWPFWFAVTVILLALYPLSFGPACWIRTVPLLSVNSMEAPPRWMMIYLPIGKLVTDHESQWHPVLNWWMMLGVAHGQAASVPTSIDGRYYVSGH